MTELIAAIPAPPSNSLGPFRLYGLMIALGVLAAVFIAQRRWRRWGGDEDDIITVAIWAVPAGLIGARLYHVITDWTAERTVVTDGGIEVVTYAERPLDALKIWDGGLGIPGGVLLGALVGIIVANRVVPSWRRLADAVAPGLPVAQAIGRLGNYFNQELYGRPTDLPWGLEVEFANRPAEYAEVETFHPTFLYEGLWNLGLAGLIIWGSNRYVLRPGRWFAVYITGYGLGRLWVEALRIDTATLVFGVRVNIWMSLVIILGGLLWLFWGGSPLDRGATERLRSGEALAAIFAAQTSYAGEAEEEATAHVPADSGSSSESEVHEEVEDGEDPEDGEDVAGASGSAESDPERDGEADRGSSARSEKQVPGVADGVGEVGPEAH
jgi:prolipoprotein diacylglyceryl transferase